MNKLELKALRRLLFLETVEAANHIGNVSARTWQYWESGRYQIPSDVKIKIRNLVIKRQELLENQIIFDTLVSYTNNLDNDNLVETRLYQSVFAERLAKTIANGKQ